MNKTINYKLDYTIYLNNDIFVDYHYLDIIYNNFKNYNDKIINEKLNYLRNIYQPEQRTDEWYNFRNNLITASNAYKIFGSKSDINSLIYEKCNYIKKHYGNNIKSSLHYGQKYEPLSIMLYEKKYNTIIESFGCIQHKEYNFLGASPDGINIKQNSILFGRMLEIKNVVSRIIDGIPKKEYWIQMQLQMECCDLDETDFLETKFTEYQNEDDFVKDGNFYLSNDNKPKGTLLLFYKNSIPYYEYQPIDILNLNDYNIWFDNMIDKNNDKTFIEKIFWKLDIFSCVLIKRNKIWFNENIEKIKTLWNTILIERQTGEFINRIPQKRIKKEAKQEIDFEPGANLVKHTKHEKDEDATLFILRSYGEKEKEKENHNDNKERIIKQENQERIIKKEKKNHNDNKERIIKQEKKNHNDNKERIIKQEKKNHNDNKEKFIIKLNI
jgi:putative phage-type endonuclease